MFNLESSIANWRQQMLAAGLESPTPLDELETHLREEIERHLHLGLGEQKAFEISVQQVGEPRSLKCEFAKTGGPAMNRNVKIGAGLAGMLLGAAMMIPGSIQLRDELLIRNGQLGLWLFGWLLIVRAMGAFQKLFSSRWPSQGLTAVKMTPVKLAFKVGAGVAVAMTGATLLFPAINQAWSAGLVEFAPLGWAVFGGSLLIAGGLFSFHPYKKSLA